MTSNRKSWSKNSFKFPSFSYSVSLREHTLWGQFFSTLGYTTLNNIATTLSLHPLAKTVLSFSPLCIWLIGSFRHTGTTSKLKFYEYLDKIAKIIVGYALNGIIIIENRQRLSLFYCLLTVYKHTSLFWQNFFTAIILKLSYVYNSLLWILSKFGKRC